MSETKRTFNIGVKETDNVKEAVEKHAGKIVEEIWNRGKGVSAVQVEITVFHPDTKDQDECHLCKGTGLTPVQV